MDAESSVRQRDAQKERAVHTTPRKRGEQRAATFARLRAPSRWAQKKYEINAPGVCGRCRERGEHFAFSKAQLQVRGLLPLDVFARFLCVCVLRLCVIHTHTYAHTQTHIAIITRRLRAGC